MLPVIFSTSPCPFKYSYIYLNRAGKCVPSFIIFFKKKVFIPFSSFFVVLFIFQFLRRFSAHPVHLIIVLYRFSTHPFHLIMVGTGTVDLSCINNVF